MKTLFLIGGCIILILAGTYWYQRQGRHIGSDIVMHQITLSGHTLNVELAHTPAEQQRGLMYRRELDEDSGMLFLFTKSEQKTFWNKNTYIPLDVIWLYEDQVVGISQLPAISEGLITVLSPSNTNHVLEVNRGWAERHDIQIGARMW